jgi:protein O-GlcNAc transferase
VRVTLEEALSRAGAQLAAGDLAAAASSYRAVLEHAPDRADVLDRLAGIEVRLGHPHRAVKLIEKAAVLRPADAALQLQLGKLRAGFGDQAAALRHYAKAIQLDPNFAEAYGELAWSFFTQQRFRDAEAVARRALAIKPALAEVRLLLGRALAGQGRLGEAVTVLREVAAALPDSAMTQLHLASALEDPAESVVAYRRALALDPSLRPIHRMLGEALRRAEGDAAALAELRRAIELVPGDAEAWAELGSALMRSDRVEAARCVERALALDARQLGALTQRIDLLQSDGDFAGAAAAFERLLAALPDRLAGERSWQRLAAIRYLDVHRPLPRALAEQVTRQIDALVAGRVSAFGALPARTRAAGPRIRLGYLSENFGDQPIGHVTMSLFAAHDRAHFEVHGFSLRDRSGEPAPFAAVLRAGFDHFHAAHHLSPRTVAQAIRDADIDILIDLDGYTGQRTPEILAYRPAPLQIVFLAHVSGLDLACADYLIADRIVIPPGEEGLHREQIVRLPDTMHCADRPAIAARPPSRASCGLPAKGFVFGGFARPEKLDGVILACWLRILQAVPGSVLMLSQPPAGAGLAEALRRLAADQGVDAERLVFAERLADKKLHLARYGHCGLLLDTPVFNAASTALDALWAGVPVLALKGDREFSRLSASLLSALGMPELICDSLATYERRAIELARDAKQLAALRQTLAAQRLSAPLFDIARFVGVLEIAYAKMWQTYLAGAPPRGFELTKDAPAPAPNKKPRRAAKPKARKTNGA